MRPGPPDRSRRPARARWLAVGALAICGATAAGRADAEPLQVQVVEVAGELAYVTPGRAAGVRPGAKIAFRRQVLVVVAVTETTAALKLGEPALAVGDTGTTERAHDVVATTAKRVAPRLPTEFVGQWREPVRPATTQDPRRVALGTGGAPGRSHVSVIGRAFGVGDLDRHSGEAEGRVIASFDLMTERPLAFDLDVAGRVFSDGYDPRTRTPVLVRAAQLRYGSAGDPRVALGRLRYAASSLGALDGGRAAMRVGKLGLAAFGGVVPDALSGKPDSQAARFGAEVDYDGAELPWQPRLAVTAHGSTWAGALDERRLALAASASRGDTWLDGWAELQGFAADNPWGASAVELTGAGATGQWRQRGRHLGVDLTYQRPERSQRLAAALPLEWLCTPTQAVGDTATTCGGGDWWASASMSAGLRTARWAIDAVGSITRTHSLVTSFDRSAYLRGERTFGTIRLEAGVSAGKSSAASWDAAEVGATYAPRRRLELSARYRPELLDYVASTGPVLLHAVVADGRYAVSPALDLSGSAMATLGTDHDSLGLLVVIAWRPLP